MIRRDYIIRMIEEFAAALARLRALKNQGQPAEALILTEQEFTAKKAELLSRI